jgi:hypothetical protein
MASEPPATFEFEIPDAIAGSPEGMVRIGTLTEGQQEHGK